MSSCAEPLTPRTPMRTRQLLSATDWPATLATPEPPGVSLALTGGGTIERDSARLDVLLITGRHVHAERALAGGDHQVIDLVGTARHPERVIPLAPDVIPGRPDVAQRFARTSPAKGLALSIDCFKA